MRRSRPTSAPLRKRGRPHPRAQCAGTVAGWLLLLISLRFLCPAAVLAHRPLATQDTGTVKPGHYDVELGQDVIHVDRHRRYLAGTYNLNVGVSNRIEVDLGVTVAYDAKERGESDGGLGDVQILGKVRLLDERSRAPALALVGSVTFPSRDVKGDLSVGETCYRAIVAATKSLGPIGLSSNAGWSFLPGASDELLLSVALDYPLSPRWQLLAEWDMARAMRSGAHETVSGLFTGLSWSPSERVSWDGGVRWGTTDADAGHRITFGLALGF